MTPMHDLPEHQMIPVDANGNGPAVNVHHYECRCGNRACDRALVDLQGWKTEATTVLAAWEEVWVTAGRPGPLGQSKAAAVKTEIERLNAVADILDGLTPPPPDQAMETARLTITSYIRDDGSNGYQVHAKGDVPMTSYLGLTVIAQREIERWSDG